MAGKPLSPKGKMIREYIVAHPNVDNKPLAELINAEQPGHDVKPADVAQHKQALKKKEEEGSGEGEGLPGFSAPPAPGGSGPLFTGAYPAPAAPVPTAAANPAAAPAGPLTLSVPGVAPMPDYRPVPAPADRAAPPAAPVVAPAPLTLPGATPGTATPFVEQLRALCMLLGKDAVKRLIDGL